MGSWKDALPSQYLKAGNFEQPRLLTIKRFMIETVGEEQKPIVYFAEDERGLVLNITNGNSIEAIAGTADPDRWVGVRVVGYKTQTDFQGKRVDCIRIRAPKPNATLPPPPPVHVDPIDESEDVPF